MKKLLALILTLALALSVCAGFAAADEAAPVTLRIFFGDDAKPDDELVQDELNKYIVPKLGIEADFVFFGSGEYNQKMPLLIASDEKMDICFDAGWIDYVNRSRAGAYLDITDMLADYQDLYNAVHPLLWEGSKVDGRNYGVPTNKEVAETWAFYAEAEVLEQNGIDPASIKTFADGEVILEALSKDPERAGFQIFAGNSDNLYMLGLLGIFDHISYGVGVYQDAPETVVSVFESPEYEAFVRTVHSWYEKGYIAEDVATRENYDQYTKDSHNYGLGYVSYSPLNEVGQSNSYGKALTPMCVTPITTTNGSCTGSINCVLAKTENPDAALKFLEAWNTDPVIKNYITFGIEGVHYNLVDGKVENVPNVNDLYVNQNWRTGNMFISYLMVNEADDKYDQYLAFNDKARGSAVLGFQPDVDEIQDRLTAIDGVRAEYCPLLHCGVLDPDEYLPIFIDELKSVGIDDVVAYYQAQLDDWRALTGK